MANGQKTKKVLDLCVEGLWLECVFKAGATNPYRLYVTTLDGGKHRRQVAAYANFVSVIDHIQRFAHGAHWGFKDTF